MRMSLLPDIINTTFTENIWYTYNNNKVFSLFEKWDFINRLTIVTIISNLFNTSQTDSILSPWVANRNDLLSLVL